MDTPARTKSIASRIWNPLKRDVWYVSELPGEGGADWGWTSDRAKARDITAYWQRRFLADMRRVGATAAKIEPA